MTQLLRLLLAIGLLVLASCPGEGAAPPADLGGNAPDSGSLADRAWLDGGPEPTADSAAGALDRGAVDKLACGVVVPAGIYKGNVSGMLTGTITVQLAAGASGLALVEQGSKMVVDKNGSKITYPLVLGSLTCGALHAALARPPGSTGGTDLRGAIDGTFVAPGTFKGTWNLPGSTTGTFKATLSP